MAWALANQFVVLTHDLDFGTLLALTHNTGPSVIQIRAQDVLPESLSSVIIAVIRQCEAALHTGALVTVEDGGPAGLRVRLLPIIP